MCFSLHMRHMHILHFFQIFSNIYHFQNILIIKIVFIGHLKTHICINNWNFSVRKTLNCISLSVLVCHHSTLHLIEWGCNSLEILTFCLLSDIVKTFTKKLNRQRNFWLLPHLINRFNSPYWPKVFVCYFVALIFHICCEFFL